MTECTLPLKFSYNVLSYEEFEKKLYNPKGKWGRKIIAIPTIAIAGSIAAICHIALIAINLVRLLLGDTKPLKATVYRIARDCHGLAGMFWGIFNDRQGEYMQHVSTTHKYLYHFVETPERPRSMLQLNLLNRNGQCLDTNAKNGYTPLLAAISLGDKNTCQELLKKGVDVNEEIEIEVEGETKKVAPLKFALIMKEQEIATLIIENGLELNPENNHGLGPESTPLCIASQYGSKEIVNRLLEKGAKIDHCSRNGSFPIHYAAQEGHLELVELFVTKGQGIDTRGWKHRTALHFAAVEGKKDVVELLLKKGEEATAQDYDGLTALDLAKKRQNNEEITALLVAKSEAEE